MNLTRANEVACTKIASVGDLANCFGLVSLTLEWWEYVSAELINNRPLDCVGGCHESSAIRP